MRQSCLAALLLAASTCLLPAGWCQSGQSTPPPPMVFAIPRVQLNSDADHFLEGVDLGFAVPLTTRHSVTGSYVLGFHGDNDITATYNYDMPWRKGIRARASAGLIEDDFGVGLSAHQFKQDFGTGAFLQTAGGEFRAGVFLSTPLSWGTRVAKPKAERSTAWGDTSGDVGDLGAIATVAARKDLDGGGTSLVTATAWYPRATANWSRMGQDAQSAAASASDFAPPATQARQYGLRGAVRGGPAVIGDTVYVGSVGGEVQALRLRDGTPLWSAAVGSDVTQAFTAVGDRLLVGTKAGHLVCLKPPLLPGGLVGSEEWRFDAGAPVLSCPLVTAKGLILFGAQDGVCYALDVRGKKVWQHATSGPILASPSLAPGGVTVAKEARGKTEGGVVYCASLDGVLYALRETDGGLVWSYRTGSPILVAPTVDDKLVYTASQKGSLHALEAATGRLAWRQQLQAPLSASPALADGRLYAPGTDGSVTALDLRDGGKALWRTQVAGPLSTPPVLTRSGYLFVGSEAGMLYALRSRDGKVLWAANVGEALTSAPAVTSGYLLVGDASGRLLAYKPGGPWHIDAPTAVASAAVPPSQAPAALTLTSSSPFGVEVPVPSREKSGLAGSSETAAGPGAISLLSVPSDPGQPPIQLADRAEIAVGGQAPASARLVLVNDVPYRVLNGQYEATVEFPGAGAYPLTVKYVDEQGHVDSDSRLVVVGEETQPTSAAPVFLSPEEEGPGGSISFTLSAQEEKRPRVMVLEIRDSTGRAIRAWADTTATMQTYVWDGRDQWGKPTKDGQYVAVFTLRDLEGHSRSLFQPVIVDSMGR